MNVIASAVNRWFKQRATSAVGAAARAAIEPLEGRVLLSISPVGYQGAALIQAGGRQIVAPLALHRPHSHTPARWSPFVAHPANVDSGPAVGRAAAGGITNPAPLADSLTPSQLRQAYGFNFALPDGTTATGAGETIAIVDATDDPTIQSDLHTFDQQYLGGVDPTFAKVNLGTTTVGWDGEESIDVEWAHAMAPQANIVLVEAASATMTDLLAAVDKAVSMGANVVSMSWGASQGSVDTGWDSHFTAPNVTFIACSGDNGAPGWYPAASPNVVGVGGTSVELDVNNNVANEVAWIDSGYSSSGGISSYEPRPAYQPATYTNGSTAGIALTGRGVPDVSYDADANNGISIYDSATGVGWSRAGGTSCGAPQWAAIVALADQIRANGGHAPLGTADVHAALYASPTDMRDIVSGSNTGSPNYTAGPGYDLVTGLGSPQVPVVVSTLVGPTGVVPAASPGLWAIPGNGQVNLNWDGSIGAAAYNVYRSTDGANYNLDATVSGTSFVDAGLSNGVGYWYEVTAANAVGESATGEIVSATPEIPPAAPTHLLATPSATSATVSLQWSATPGVGQYVVKRAKFSGGPWVVIASDVQGASFTDLDATNGRTYFYAVSALTSAGQESADSNVVSATVIPAAPTSLTATAGKSQIALAWSASTGATSYNVLRSTTNGGGYVLVASGVTATSFTNTKLTAGTTYYYVVQAVDPTGPSAYSNQASATPKSGR
jgi:fibronectin type 3 domain-containing protein